MNRGAVIHNVTALLSLRATLTIRFLIVAIIAAGVLTGTLAGPLRTTVIAVVFFVVGSLVARDGNLSRILSPQNHGR